MKKTSVLFLLMSVYCTANAASRLDSLVQRLRLFGERIPQEKVYVHMDNTCYFLGDTIWFAAYTCQTDSDKPSTISRVLYAELFNEDGYLMARKTIRMTNGRGNGFFSLADTSLYAGFYELRAYTRWQLNWGRAEREHSDGAEEWFFNRQMAKEYYRDYDKLYSRVFPVYDHPKDSVAYNQWITPRPLRRATATSSKPRLHLTLYPEGGQLVDGCPCRVAFEAAMHDGMAVEGTLVLRDINGDAVSMGDGFGNEVSAASTSHRGRGIFEFTPQYENLYEAEFTSADGLVAKAELPIAQKEGVAIVVRQGERQWHITTHVRGIPEGKQLKVEIAHEGKVLLCEPMKHTLLIRNNDLPMGVNQLIVSDDEGRVYADRLFFVTKTEQLQPTLAVSGLKEQYKPFEKVSLKITDVRSDEKDEAFISLAIRDAAASADTYDSGNIMTEMLLTSEIKGFVPQPEWFFESDDEDHRRGLDLLMMTQGWRRFTWHEPAFVPTEPAEDTPVLMGEIYPFAVRWRQNEQTVFDSLQLTYTAWDIAQSIQRLPPGISEELKTLQDSTRLGPMRYPMYQQFYDHGWGEIIEALLAEMKGREDGLPAGSYRMTGSIARSRFLQNKQLVNDSLRIHAEFLQPDDSLMFIIDSISADGTFKIQAPPIVGDYLLFLAASDSTKWQHDRRHRRPRKSREHRWILPHDDYPEYYVRVHHPYPRFVKPYNYYQTHLDVGAKSHTLNPASSTAGDKFPFDTQMSTMTVTNRWKGLRAIDFAHPTITVDALKAYNDITDAGLSAGWFEGRTSFIHSLARYYTGDLGSDQPGLLEPRYEARNMSCFISPVQLNAYNELSNLQDIRVYSDYHPRSPANSSSDNSIQRVSIDLHRIPDNGQRIVYRDRRYVLQGFSVCEDFYHPDYHRNPPKEGQKDYRRTLYWNPDLQLDADGHTYITFFNNSQTTSITVEAEGMTNRGDLLFNNVQ